VEQGARVLLTLRSLAAALAVLGAKTLPALDAMPLQVLHHSRTAFGFDGSR
jgi:hypothetical protein